MKKNKMMRIASVLLVAVLLSTCAISGTFAKYITTAEAGDSARVAAWGFGDNTSITFELFNTSYDDVNSSESGVNVIAPGTTQSETIQLSYGNTAGKGAPEVDYTVDINVDKAEIGENIKNNKNIIWSFNGTSYDHTETATSWDQMITALEAYHEDVEANQLPTINKSGINISWTWNFVDDNAANEADTNLGNAATLEEVELEISIVAAQVNNSVNQTPAEGEGQ